MMIYCQHDSLLAACQLVAAAVAVRSTKTILMSIKAIAEAERLTLVATDLEVGVRYEIAGVRSRADRRRDSARCQASLHPSGIA